MPFAGGRGRAARFVLVFGVFVWLLAVARPALGEEAGDIEFIASVDGLDVGQADASNPLPLGVDDVVIEIEVLNDRAESIVVETMRFEGAAAGLDFFAYVVRIDIELGPGERGERRFVLDLGDIDEQAVGLLPARFALVAPDGDVLASKRLVVDVQGSMTSAYGIFGLLVFAATALLLAAAIVRLATNKLPLNRWRRGVYFGVPGLGIGLCLTFGLSVMRILTPHPTLWVGLLTGGGVVGFALGYLTPTPYDEASDRDALDEYEDSLDAALANSQTVSTG